MKKRNIAITVYLILTIVFYGGCKITDGLSKEEKISFYENKIINTNYTFIPSSAIPSNGMKTVHLNSSYALKISKDTIISYLPYFGRAYTAPYPNGEGGIKFSSTDFEYKTSPKNKGMWNINIETKDTTPKYQLIMNIGETGYTTLIVQENNRQSISFYGQIE